MKLKNTFLKHVYVLTIMSATFTALAYSGVTSKQRVPKLSVLDLQIGNSGAFDFIQLSMPPLVLAPNTQAALMANPLAIERFPCPGKVSSKVILYNRQPLLNPEELAIEIAHIESAYRHAFLDSDFVEMEKEIDELLRINELYFPRKSGRRK
jgi:hypothetical protein